MQIWRRTNPSCPRRTRRPRRTPTGRYSVIREHISGLWPTLDIGCKYNLIGDFGIDIDPSCSPHVVANVLCLPFRDTSFQAIVFSEVLEHLPRDTEVRALREIGRTLRPGGILVLSTPKRCLLNKVSDPAHYLANHRHYSTLGLLELLREAGLSTRSVQTIGGIWNAVWSTWYYTLWFLFGIEVPTRIIQEADDELVHPNPRGTTLVAIAEVPALSGG